MVEENSFDSVDRTVPGKRVYNCFSGVLAQFLAQDWAFEQFFDFNSKKGGTIFREKNAIVVFTNIFFDKSHFCGDNGQS